MWEVVDLKERPDLRATLAQDRTAKISCVACGFRQGRSLPMLVLHLYLEAPIVLGVGDEALLLDDPMAPSQALLQTTQLALGPRINDLPGPVVAAPFDVLAEAAARDVAADVLASAEDVVPPRYGTFIHLLRESRSRRRLNAAYDRMWLLTSIDDLRLALAEVPEITSEELIARLSGELAAASDDEERLVRQARLDLARLAADGRVEEGWRGYEQALLRISKEHHASAAIEMMEQLRASGERGDLDCARAVGDELLSMMGGVECNGFCVEALMRTGAAYCQSSGPGIEDRLDYAIELFRRARTIIDAGVDDPAEQEAVSHERVRVLLNEGTAFARRRRGDPESNHEHACDLLREVLRRVSLDSEPGVWAMASTNLGMSLATRAKRRDQEDSAREPEISEAIELLQGALRWRSFERNPLDWSYTQTGLGLAYGARGSGDHQSNVRKAIEHHRAAVRGLQAAGAAELEAQAWHNAASEMLVLLWLNGTGDADRETLLSQAVHAFRRSLALRPMHVDPVGAGSTYSGLASALELAGDIKGAIDARREALKGLRPDTAPQAARDEARELAELAKRAGDWEVAARAYEIAVEASIAALESRADSVGRFDELGHSLTVFRWAAEALLRTGRSRRAVEVLEQGRARELAAWLHRNASTADLRERDPALHARLLALQKQLERQEQDRRAGLPVELRTAAEAQEGYRQTLTEIRRLPGFERFRLPESYDDIAAAVPEGEALVYLFSAPEGTAALVVTRGANPEVVEARRLTSGRLIRLLIRPDEESGDLVGYLPAQSSSSARLDREIEDLSEILGPTLLQPLARCIARSGADTVCVVAAGLLGLLPLHALAWSDGSERLCLLERFCVVMAPSAMARRICRQRAAERGCRGAVLAVGNPLPSPNPLRWAEQEAMNVAHTFPSPSTRILLGVDATADAVIDALQDAWIAHLACHGSAAMSAQALDNALYLAGGESVTGADLLGLAPLQARLVVASACETAIIPGYETVDEALSLGTVLIGAGAAGAIASLWSVDDFATALLMSRFYDELAADATPAHALRSATLWLRDLPRVDAEAYAETRPALRAMAEQTGSLGRGEEQQPFASARLWAPFVLSGA